MDKQIRDFIRRAKADLRARSDVAASFAQLREAMRREVDEVRSLAARGESVIPELDFRDIRGGRVDDDMRRRIRARGCVVIRGVFERARARDWNDEIGDYLARNRYLERMQEKAGLDNYFGELKSGRPQIYGIYWSRPQIQARQGESMAETKRFLNRLWDVRAPAGDEFDPDFDYTYADRTRRREPGDTSLGLSPHMDAGSYERWLDPAFRQIYAPVFAGDWQGYDPWKAAHRTQTREFASPAVCSMFRTFQGWTALTTQGPRDGTLSLIPISRAIAYVLLRALQDDVAEDDLCGAKPGRALGINETWHADLMPALITIPEVGPGDTVWWHPDTVHAVADEHAGDDYANVIYIGAAPKCARNEAYVRRQAPAFLQGRSPPDFAPEDFEVDFQGRATPEDLSDLGRAQMGL